MGSVDCAIMADADAATGVGTIAGMRAEVRTGTAVEDEWLSRVG